MDLLTNLDPFAVAATALVAILAACVAILVLMRDRESAPPRLISWQVWCAERGQRAVVDFVERACFWTDSVPFWVPAFFKNMSA